MTEVKENIDYSVIAGFLRGIRPDPLLTVSQWADQYRILPQSSAEPGRFRTSRTPYLQEIQDKLSITDPAQKVVVKKGSQLGFTETGNNWFGYIIDIAPSSMLYVMPTDLMMKDTSKNRISKMIEASDRLRSKIKPTRAKESSNTLLFKEFEGGFAKFVGANSPVGLASTPIRFVYLDEVDRYPMDVSGEGSAISLAQTRTSTYGARKKILITSTPTRDGQSAIDIEFQKTGQRRYHVPCPHCGGAQVLRFENLVKVSENDYSDVRLSCIHCGDLIPERFKSKMLAGGKWIPDFPDKEDGVTFGYWINAMYSPYGWYSWASMLQEYNESSEDIPSRITWTNTKNGECYSHEGDSPEWEVLYALRENYPKNTIRDEVAFITAGVDVQADRLELEIVGWIRGKRSQSIDYRIIIGNTEATETWDKLAAVLNETFTRSDGHQMPISIMCVDTGFNTSYVYEFCSRMAGTGRVFPIKGKDGLQQFYTAPKPVQVTRQGKPIGGIKVYHIGVSLIKSELYGWLKQFPKDQVFPNGYCHFPQYDQEFFKGITAEKLQSKTDRRGFLKMEWVKHHKRNEPLDCRIYARAGAALFGMDMFQDSHWDHLEKPTSPPPQKPKKDTPREDSYW